MVKIKIFILYIFLVIFITIKSSLQNNTEQTYEYRMNSSGSSRKVTRNSNKEILVEPVNGEVKGSLVWMHGLGDTAEVSFT